MLLTDLIIWSGTGLFFRRGGISRTGCTVKHWISGSDHSGIKRHYMMESISIQPCVKIYKQIAGRDMSDFQWLGFNTQIHQKVKCKLKKKKKARPKTVQMSGQVLIHCVLVQTVDYVQHFLCPHTVCVLCCQKDTLKRRVLDIFSWHGGGVEAHGAWELAHQMVLKVLSAFILLPTVDKHLVLKRQ